MVVLLCYLHLKPIGMRTMICFFSINLDIYQSIVQYEDRLQTDYQ